MQHTHAQTPGGKGDRLQTAMKWKGFGGVSPISAFMSRLHPLSPAAVSCIDEHTFPVLLKKGKFLISPFNDNHDHYYFILKGVIRGYMLADGLEITTWINEEYELVGSIRGMGLDVHTGEYLQALEDTTLVGFPITFLDWMYEHFPEINIIGRKLLEQSYRDAEERAYISRLPSAEKRYERFARTRAGLLNRIPLKYSASYLGMKLETLSRIRSRFLKKQR
jgi:CRP-like cAMP-binding protein